MARDWCPGSGGDGSTWAAYDGVYRPTDHYNVDGLTGETRGNGVWAPVVPSWEEGPAIIDEPVTVICGGSCLACS